MTNVTIQLGIIALENKLAKNIYKWILKVINIFIKRELKG